MSSQTTNSQVWTLQTRKSQTTNRWQSVKQCPCKETLLRWAQEALGWEGSCLDSPAWTALIRIVQKPCKPLYNYVTASGAHRTGGIAQLEPEQQERLADSAKASNKQAWQNASVLPQNGSAMQQEHAKPASKPVKTVKASQLRHCFAKVKESARQQALEAFDCALTKEIETVCNKLDCEYSERLVGALSALHKVRDSLGFSK